MFVQDKILSTWRTNLSKYYPSSRLLTPWSIPDYFSFFILYLFSFYWH